MKSPLRFSAVLTLFAGMVASTAVRAEQAPAAPGNSAALEFFESKVRPILAEQCFNCHGPKKQMGGGLRLDSSAGMLKGGDTGPAIVPGKPDISPMIRAIHYAGDVKMPPKNKLPAEAIDVLTAWVKMGAPWPADSTATRPGGPDLFEAARKHWAFHPVRKPTPPPGGGAWVQSSVDAFILAKLQAAGFTPAPPADRRTLVRRLYFDLVGLPPTPQDVETALSDRSLDWYPKLVERLLASPQYGERWARHWLDVARYADTKGYVFLEERRFPFSFTYRDYVVRAFNEDLPYDQFVREQLAADQAAPVKPASGDPDRRYLAAMGYLTLGRRFLNNVHDVIDDRIDVTMRGFQGLTVTCARCHDHKFDPIPTKDYYSLYGVFQASVEPKDLPIIGAVQHTEAYRAYELELQAREAKLREANQGKLAELQKRLRTQVGDYLIAVREVERLPGEDHYEALNPGDLNPEIVRRWQGYLAETRKKHHPIFAPWHVLAALPQKDFKEKALVLAERYAANSDPAQPLNPLVAKMFAGKQPQSLQEVARWYGELFKECESTKPQAADHEAVRKVLYGENTPIGFSLAEAEAKRFFDRDTRNQLAALKKKVDEWKANSTGAPPRAMVLNDIPNPGQVHVLVRGNPRNVGDAVPRQFLAILSGESVKRQAFKVGSGRLELAQAIASKDNPLTARVMVNRIWLHHFGQGIVRTPSDFGLRGEPPTHPELLDYLARYFMDSNWSVKQMHRLIVNSSTYQQSSTGDPRLATADPENRLLAHQNRRRLDFEQLRDSLLFAAGRLDLTAGGPGVDMTTTPFTRRRTIYGFIERQNLPGMFRTFDFANPDTTSPQRYTTTVPQQSLFLMNSPFVVEQAKHLAARTSSLGAAERIQQLYGHCYGRKPDGEELSLGMAFIDSAGGGDSKTLAAWEKYAQVLLLSNEFAFVD